MTPLDTSERAFQPASEAAPVPPPPSSPGSTALDILNLADLLTRPPAEPEWIWHGRLAAGDVALWAGDPGVGKSMVALALTVAVASGGGTVLDEPSGYGNAVMLDLENTIDIVLERVRAFHPELDALDLAYVHRPPGFNLVRKDWQARLAATLAAHRPRLLVIDSLRRAAPALDENDSKAVSEIMGTVRGLAAEHGCAIVLVHHPRKPLADGQVDALHAARGSGDLVASVDSLLFFRRLKGGLVKIEHAKARRGHPHEPGHYRIVENENGGPLLQLVDVAQTDADAVDEAVLAYVVAHPGESTDAVRKGVKKRREIVESALARLGQVEQVYSKSSRDLGRTGTGTYWFAANHAGFDSSGGNGASRDESPATVVPEADLSDSSAARRADKSADEPLESELDFR